MHAILSDIRFALRQLRRAPGFAVTAVLTLGLAIGANTAIFTLLDQALLSSLPVREPSKLVVLSFAGEVDGHMHNEGGDSPGHTHYFTYSDYKEMRDRNTVLSGLAAAEPLTLGVKWGEQAENARAEIVSGNYFQMLGVPAAAGRVLAPADDTAPGANPVAVLSFDYWKRRLGEAPVTGKTLLINGQPFTVLGVAAPGFHSMTWGDTPEIWVPLSMQKVVDPDYDWLNDPKSYWLTLTGRLKPGVTAAQAEAAMDPLFRAIRADDFRYLRDQSAAARKSFVEKSRLHVDSGARGFSPQRDSLRTPLTIVMAMVLLVVAMAAINVASLLLVRAATRVREFSMRYALGATNVQVLRQLLAEGLLLSALGALVGLLLAPQVLRALIAWMAGRTPEASPFTSEMNWTVMGFTGAAVLLVGLAFSLAPALQFWNPRLAESLKQQVGTGTGAALRFRKTCVMLQIGFSLLLLVGAGLFVRTVQNLKATNTGFPTDHLLSFDLTPEFAGYPSAEVPIVEKQVLDALAAVPGVKAVGATADPDLVGSGTSGDVTVPGTGPKNDGFDAELPWVSDSYLQTLGVPLLAGRYFNSGDTASADHVVIVNEKFAKQVFGSVPAALGHHMTRPGKPKDPAAGWTIVGVVGNVKHQTVRDDATVTAYRPFLQADQPDSQTVYIRTWQAPGTATASIREAVRRVDSRLIVEDIATLDTRIDDSLSNERAIALLAAAFGILAVVMAGIGVYGILAYTTAQRTREIGIRMALGARRTTVVGLILREVLVLAGIAIAVTVPLALVASRALRSELYGVSTGDIAVYSVAVLVIGGVALTAALLPARRAASIEPSRALRDQ
ncbi:ABC transporter permease [Silvibacterium sp.]|uniref:ABC transporter permease n=1 Tax=Silvibacterium sp. TaxID=1964179 RepID=UPI0039E26098